MISGHRYPIDVKVLDTFFRSSLFALFFCLFVTSMEFHPPGERSPEKDCWKSNVIGRGDGEWCISIRFVSEGCKLRENKRVG